MDHDYTSKRPVQLTGVSVMDVCVCASTQAASINFLASVLSLTGNAGQALALWHLHTQLRSHPRITLPGTDPTASVLPLMLERTEQVMGAAWCVMHPHHEQMNKRAHVHHFT